MGNTNNKYKSFPPSYDELYGDSALPPYSKSSSYDNNNHKKNKSSQHVDTFNKYKKIISELNSIDYNSIDLVIKQLIENNMNNLVVINFIDEKVAYLCEKYKCKHLLHNGDLSEETTNPIILINVTVNFRIIKFKQCFLMKHVSFK